MVAGVICSLLFFENSLFFFFGEDQLGATLWFYFTAIIYAELLCEFRPEKNDHAGIRDP